MVGLISDNSVFTHIYTQMRYIRTINCLTLVKTTKISLSRGWSVVRGWGEGGRDGRKGAVGDGGGRGTLSP